MALSQVGVALTCTEAAFLKLVLHVLSILPHPVTKSEWVATSPPPFHPVPVTGDAPHSGLIRSEMWPVFEMRLVSEREFQDGRLHWQEGLHICLEGRRYWRKERFSCQKRVFAD